MRGMGSYTKVEEQLSVYSADEMNELFLSGDLDKIYDDFERERELEVSRGNSDIYIEEIEDIDGEEDEL